MKAFTAAILLVLHFAGANDYINDWENTIPDCAPKQCGKQGECPQFQTCRERGNIEACTRVWPFRFCDRSCQGLPGGSPMVRDPSRYCECIREDELNAQFCEVPPMEPEPEDCVCIEIFQPVTCQDGIEYSNSCFAECAGQTQCDETPIEPEEPVVPLEPEEPVVPLDPFEPEVCICTLQFDPVQCEDGNGYSNQCFASCAGQSKCQSTSVEPEPICECPKISLPVTCEDGEEYSNQCLATCDGQEEECPRTEETSTRFNKSVFTDLINFYDNSLNRPTGLGVDIPIGQRKGGYVDLATFYSKDNNRPTSLGNETTEPIKVDDEAFQNLSAQEKLQAQLQSFER